MASLIAVDWGTTSFRAYLFEQSGACVDRISAQSGIMQVDRAAFEDTFYENLHSWLTRYPTVSIIASGMITSNQGWVETPYLTCPTSLKDLSKNLTRHETRGGHEIYFVSGVCQQRPTANIMRGEETQMAGLSRTETHIAILPGTHSKWILMENQMIKQFWTFMTGEIFAALINHTILGRLVIDGEDHDAFLDGVQEGFATQEGGGILSKLFGARALPVLKKMEPKSIKDYISGLLLGTEIQEALGSGLASDANPVIVGESGLARRYKDALETCGFTPELGEEDLAARGLLRIATEANLVSGDK